jgi:hypothetical protein
MATGKHSSFRYVYRSDGLLFVTPGIAGLPSVPTF